MFLKVMKSYNVEILCSFNLELQLKYNDNISYVV